MDESNSAGIVKRARAKIKNVGIGGLLFCIYTKIIYKFANYYLRGVKNEKSILFNSY